MRDLQKLVLTVSRGIREHFGFGRLTPWETFTRATHVCSPSCQPFRGNDDHYHRDSIP